MPPAELARHQPVLPGLTVRVDIAGGPGTWCKHLPGGMRATFTSSSHWADGPQVARGVVSCGGREPSSAEAWRD